MNKVLLSLSLTLMAMTIQANNQRQVSDNLSSITASDTDELEQLNCPAMNLWWDEGGNGYLSFNDLNDPPAVIYYKINDGTWMPYTDVLVFRDDGDYLVQAFCDGVPGYAPSVVCSQSFTVAHPTSFSEFEEDGICYVLINDFEVAVTRNVPQHSSYNGHVVIPETVNHNGVMYRVSAIAASAFADCTGLTAITIPESVNTIGETAFAGCYSLTSLTLPSSITHIDDWAFTGCSHISDVTCLAVTPPQIGYYTFEDPWVEDEMLNNAVYRFATLHVPQESLVAYCKNLEWTRFEHIQAIAGHDKPGDINGDGNINVSDVTLLIRMILNAD